MSPSRGDISSRAGAVADPATGAPRPAGPCPSRLTPPCPRGPLPLGAEPPPRPADGSGDAEGAAPGVGLEEPRVDPARGVLRGWGVPGGPRLGGVWSGAGRASSSTAVGARGYKVGVPGCGAGYQRHPVIPTPASQSWLDGGGCVAEGTTLSPGCCCEPFLGCNCGGRRRSVSSEDRTLLQHPWGYPHGGLLSLV